VNLSLGYITSRQKPCLEWFIDSLAPQLTAEDSVEILVITDYPKTEIYQLDLIFCEPKPCVWSGNHRLTKDNWWSKSNSLNTFFCLCKYDYVALVDDRSVAGPQWMQSVRDAYAGNYLVLGSYAKYHNMKVSNGQIVEQGTFDGKDGRGYSVGGIHKAPPQHFFGCNWASPLEWILEINGAETRLDATSMEDIMLGHHFTNAGYLLKFDARLFITEDRTPSELGTPYRRSSRQRFNFDHQDRAWRALATFANDRRANPDFSLRDLRAAKQRGEPWPDVNPNAVDWWNGKPITDWDNVA